MNKLILVGILLVAIPGWAAAQEAQSNLVLTRGGWEIGAQVSKYKYDEPDFAKFEGERMGVVGAYTGVNPSGVFSRIDARGSFGSLDYTGSGTKSNVPDRIFEVRVVVGKDFQLNSKNGLSPYVGLGYRYLYNDLRGFTTTGAIGFQRISQYGYVPIGLTLRNKLGERWAIATTLEYDAFLGGRQESRLTDTGIGFFDASNQQDDGRGYRVYVMAETENWSFGPWLHYWNIKDSDIVSIGLGFVALEPANTTHEAGFELRYRF